MRWIVVPMGMLLASCSATGPVTSEFCAIADPITVSRADVLSDHTARQVLAHNETWARLCR